MLVEVTKVKEFFHFIFLEDLKLFSYFQGKSLAAIGGEGLNFLNENYIMSHLAEKPTVDKEYQNNIQDAECTGDSGKVCRLEVRFDKGRFNNLLIVDTLCVFLTEMFNLVSG